MKKSTLSAIVNYLSNNLPFADEEEKDFLQTTIGEINSELARGAEKAQANRDLYESAHDVVMNGLQMATNPVTIGELYESIADELPEGFSKGKVQYAITRLWADEVTKTEGKVNAYSRKG